MDHMVGRQRAKSGGEGVQIKLESSTQRSPARFCPRTLFVIYINDIDKGLCSDLVKFVDDTKLFCRVASSEEAFSLQEDLQKLYKWSQDWQMPFNAEKSGCIHIGNSNNNFDYFMGDSFIGTINQEKDLGVIIHQSLKPDLQVAPGHHQEEFQMQRKPFIIRLYKSLIRPHLG
jgi:hypothetical protein